MNLNPLIISTLAPVGFPIAQDENDTEDDKYIIFTYEDERPEEHGDDKVISDTAQIQIQLLTPKKYDYLAKKDQIRDLLESAGFVVNSIKSYLGYEMIGTERVRQTVFETEYNKEREEYENAR